MNLETRIKRRRESDEETKLLQKYKALSPVAHVADPTNRDSVIEQLLDHFDPLFDDEDQSNLYLYGPRGAGKSALVQALFSQYDRLTSDGQSFLHTSIPVQTSTSPEFVYIDARQANSEFEFCHRLLDTLVEDSVPRRGIGFETLQSRVQDQIDEQRAPVAVAVDHLGEPNGITAEVFASRIDLLPDTVCWLGIGRDAPDATCIGEHATTHISLEPYGRQTLIDILISRASTGLAGGLLDYRQAQHIADWADGDAHDALAILFVATDLADRSGRTRVSDEDITAAIEEIPDACVSLGRVLALPDKRQTVLYELVTRDRDNGSSISETAQRIASRSSSDISKATIKRYLYEMAEKDILVRNETDAPIKPGRNPSRVEPCFVKTAFRRLYDLQRKSNR